MNEKTKEGQQKVAKILSEEKDKTEKGIAELNGAIKRMEVQRSNLKRKLKEIKEQEENADYMNLKISDHAFTRYVQHIHPELYDQLVDEIRKSKKVDKKLKGHVISTVTPKKDYDKNK